MSITSLFLDAEHAIQLGNALRHGAVAAKSTANSLVLSLGGKRLGFNGWGSYINVVGATHNAKAQAKHTTLLYRGEAGMLQHLRAGLPGFDSLERMALDACPGMQVDFPPQTSLGLNSGNVPPGGKIVEMYIYVWGCTFTSFRHLSARRNKCGKTVHVGLEATRPSYL